MNRMTACLSLACLAAAAAGTGAAAQSAESMKMLHNPTLNGSPDPATYGAEVKAAYDRVRAATSPFQKLDAAVAAGYDATVPTCWTLDGVGGMGYHHANKNLMDRTLEVEHPEILIYERRADGSYALNGVEYLVPYRLWPADSTPPRLMGRALARSDDLKVWYMHMWIWKSNPAGLFANYNPSVTCRTPPA